jgi:hypothetical protein
MLFHALSSYCAPTVPISMLIFLAGRWHMQLPSSICRALYISALFNQHASIKTIARCVLDCSSSLHHHRLGSGRPTAALAAAAAAAAADSSSSSDLSCATKQ